MNDRDLFEFLKAELAFLQLGGYDKGLHALWRAPLVFEDSPNCLTFNRDAPERPCSDCPLMTFVPEHRRNENIPCRFIPLDSDGQTLDSLYRTATKEETLEVVRTWLKNEIAELAKTARKKAS